MKPTVNEPSSLFLKHTGCFLLVAVFIASFQLDISEARGDQVANTNAADVNNKTVVNRIKRNCQGNSSRLREAWTQFKSQHRKSYRSSNQERGCFGNFIKTYRKIVLHNQELNSTTPCYQVELNPLADLSAEQLQNLYKAKPPTKLNLTELPPISKLYSGGAQNFSFYVQNFTEIERLMMMEEGNSSISSNGSRRTRRQITLQNSVDWRQQGYLTPVVDQGSSCGSCYAFVAAGAIESQVFKKSGILTQLSAQQIVDCSTGYGNLGCNGGWMMNAYNYIEANNNLMKAASYPYTGVKGQCISNWGLLPSQGISAAVYVTPSGDERALSLAVQTIGPIVSAMDASRFGFIYYKRGIYLDNSCSQTVNHAVLIVGFGTDNGQDYWLIKNTWGTAWGDNGYGKVARNQNNMCGIASYGQYPIL